MNILLLSVVLAAVLTGLILCTRELLRRYEALAEPIFMFVVLLLVIYLALFLLLGGVL